MMKQATSVATHVEHTHSQAGIALLRIAFRVSLVLTVAVVGLVGLWAAACLIGGAASVGGPLELAAGWFSAVSGT